jgi:Tfp pilus assembly protein PilO
MIKKVIIAILPLTTIAIIVWFIMPEYDNLTLAKADRAAQEESLTSKQAYLTKLNKLKEKYDEAKGLVPRVDQIFPSTPDIPNLLAEVPDIAGRNGMNVTNIAFSDTKGASTDDATAPAESYKSMLINLSVSGSYDSFKNFLRDMEKELRIMDVQSVQFVVPSISDDSSTEKEMSFTLGIKTYFALSK